MVITVNQRYSTNQNNQEQNRRKSNQKKKIKKARLEEKAPGNGAN